MPNIKSAMKRAKTSEINRRKNSAVTSRVTTCKNKLYAAIEKKNKEEASKLFKEYCSVTDKAVKKGVLKKNNGDRRKSRAALKMAAMA